MTTAAIEKATQPATSGPAVSETLRVLQIVDSLGMGGAETWLVALLRHWSSQSPQPARMDFLLTGGKTGVFDDEVRRLGARLFYVPYRRNSIRSFIREFRQILRAGQYHAVHDHADFSSGWRFLFGTGQLPPVRVTHVHNPAYQILNNYGIKRSRRWASRIGKGLVSNYASVVLGTSRQVLGEYGFTLSDDARPCGGALHCGFAVERFSGNHRDHNEQLCRELGWEVKTPIILFAGRLDESLEPNHPRNHKNSALAVRIFRECVTHEPRLKMIMAGANDHVKADFQNYLSELGLTENVRHLGIRRDIDHLMLASRLLLFPSRAEGLGMVAVEAQAAGLPIVASSAVPREAVVIPELVQFVDLDESDGTWADKILETIRQPRPAPTSRDSRWVESPFNISVSSRLLQSVYRTGTTS